MSEGVDVYIMQAKDLFRFALCFGRSIFEFTTQDERGPVSCFSPHSTGTSEGIVWRTSSRVKISEDFDSDEWSNAVHYAFLTHGQLKKYREWLQGWLEENSYYTVLEGGSNVRKFITDSLAAIQRLGAAMAKSRLFLPDVCTYVLEYGAKEACSASDAQSISRWYSARDEADLHCTVQSLNSSEFAYYHESSAWGERYWSLSNPRFRLQGGKIKLPAGTTATNGPVAIMNKEGSDLISRLRTPLEAEVVAVQQASVDETMQRASVDETMQMTGPISVVHSQPITTIPILAQVTPVGGNTMLVIIILVAVLVLIIFFAVVYYASYHTTRVMSPPAAFVTPMTVSI